MIADEVICGYGRMGKNFGSDVFGIKPGFNGYRQGINLWLFSQCRPRL